MWFSSAPAQSSPTSNSSLKSAHSLRNLAPGSPMWGIPPPLTAPNVGEKAEWTPPPPWQQQLDAREKKPPQLS